MSQKGWGRIILIGWAVCMLAGCGNAKQQAAETTAEEVSAEAETTTEGAAAAELEELAALLGMQDEDTAGLFGGGEENWTADKSLYIGRKYQIDVAGVPCEVSTSCGQDGSVEAVSIWIVSGEREVTEEEVAEWKKRITNMMGVDPVCDETVSEGGSKNCRWTANGLAASLYQMTDILTVSLQPAIGELK